MYSCELGAQKQIANGVPIESSNRFNDDWSGRDLAEFRTSFSGAERMNFGWLQEHNY